jgi:hypothetical protein
VFDKIRKHQGKNKTKKKKRKEAKHMLPKEASIKTKIHQKKKPE